MAPRALPSVRFTDRLRGSPSFRRDPLAFLPRGRERYGDIFRFRTLGIPMVMVNHPDHIRRILVDKSTQYDKNASLYKAVRPVLRTGLIANADTEQWRRQRRMMAPHFTPGAVGAFARNMTTETVRMLDRWERDPRDERVIDAMDEFGRLALAIVNRSLFSADVSTTAQGFERAFGVANSILAAFFRCPFPPLSVPTPSRRRLRRAIDAMDSFVSGFVQGRLCADTDAEPDLLTLLLHSADEEDGRGMALERLHHEVLNLCVGAYETTTNALCWAFHLLARHPDAEKRLHEEVDRVLGDRIPQFEDLPELAYTRMVVDETLRIYSPAYQFMRHASQDDEIAGYRIPAGSNMLINSYVLHRHPDFWDEPETFRPERFGAEEIAGRPRHAYIPFGSGQRVCIGRHFALTELTLVLATVARTYRLVLPVDAPDVHPEALITLRPRGGMRLRLEHR
ncbi:cytochrome P450 [Streptomyces sp. 4N124]|uniref:cytochrome P450 n=1 Tax=Streptomyces sp. 4N124 TaxID=3457420 RepID=UPI003FD12A0C